jgi:hypothetical protein
VIVLSVEGWVDAEVTTIHALGGQCCGCGEGGCERSARAQEALAEWARTGQVRAGLARHLLDLVEAGRVRGAAPERGPLWT